MQIAIRKITPFRSQHGGHDCFRIDGLHENEFGELVKGYTFIDPNNDNSVNWVRVIETHYEYRGEDIICLLYTSPSPRDATLSRMPSSA